jgi:hypothetical protein
MSSRQTILFIFLCCLCCAGCKKDFVSINSNPNVITEPTVDFSTLFTNAEMVTSGNSDGNGYEDWRNNLIYSSCMIQHLSSTAPYWDGDKYLYSAAYNSAYWDRNYPNSIANMVEVITHLKDNAAQSNFYQIARIFRVFIFQRMTDMYGDCPYSQAGLGYISGITSPKYDKQEDIYADMFNELQDATTKLDPNAINTVGLADLIYGGDPVKWKKFAFSEMLRLAMRLCKAAPSTAQKWVQVAIQGGVMGGNTDNAIVQHQNIGGTPVPNGTGLILIGNDPNGYRMSNTFIDYLKTQGDPRLSYLATVCADPMATTDKGDTSFALQRGQANGYDPPNSGLARDLTKAPDWPGNQNSYSVVNRYTFGRLDAPTFLLTCGETALLSAEAAQRGWIGGDPGQYYNEGVKGAMQQLALQAGAGPPDLSISGWLAAHPYDPSIALQQINVQYWVATFMDENESFANWRRSGYPVLVPVDYPGNITNGAIPRRFTYPQSESSDNTDNYAAAVAGLAGGDNMSSRVWWDK